MWTRFVEALMKLISDYQHGAIGKDFDVLIRRKKGGLWYSWDGERFAIWMPQRKVA